MTIETTLLQTKERKRHGIHNSIVECIGRTPVVKISPHMAPDGGADVYVKMESHNPGGSVKDRFAAGIIEWAEKHGQLTPGSGQTVVEASSGNTGIGLAMVCASKGYPFICVMSESYSVERRKLMRFYGAQVILTSREHNATGMILKAKALAEEHGFFFANQYEAEANAWIHEQTTGQEIAEAFDEAQLSLDHVVMHYESGGTLAGVSRRLKSWKPDIKVHACEPSNAPLLHSGIETKYPEDGYPSTSFETSHPAYHPHALQGWAVDFIPKIMAKAKETNAYDDIMHVTSGEAIQVARDLAMKEGICSGISGGGVLSAALRLARELPAGQSVLAILADTGERYLSTSLFDGVPLEMGNEEKYLDATTIAELPRDAPLPQPSSEAVQFVKETVQTNKVVVWSLQDCENCRALTEFLMKLRIDHERIDIDNFKYCKNQMGDQYRAALLAMTGDKKLPKIFIGGQCIGGIQEALSMWSSGLLTNDLEKAGISLGVKNAGDPTKVFPDWIVKEHQQGKRTC